MPAYALCEGAVRAQDWRPARIQAGRSRVPFPNLTGSEQGDPMIHLDFPRRQQHATAHSPADVLQAGTRRDGVFSSLASGRVIQLCHLFFNAG